MFPKPEPSATTLPALAANPQNDGGGPLYRSRPQLNTNLKRQPGRKHFPCWRFGLVCTFYTWP